MLRIREPIHHVHKSPLAIHPHHLADEKKENCITVCPSEEPYLTRFLLTDVLDSLFSKCVIK